MNEGQGPGPEDGCPQLRLCLSGHNCHPHPGDTCHSRQQQGECGRLWNGGRGARAVAWSPVTRHGLAQPGGAVAGGPEVRRKVSLLPRPLEGDRASVSPGNRGGDVGRVVTVHFGATECCPRPATSPGSQRWALSGPVGASWTAWSCLCHLGPIRDTLGASVSPVCLPPKSSYEGKGDIEGKGHRWHCAWEGSLLNYCYVAKPWPGRKGGNGLKQGLQQRYREEGLEPGLGSKRGGQIPGQ